MLTAKATHRHSTAYLFFEADFLGGKGDWAENVIEPDKKGSSGVLVGRTGSQLDAQ
jgi:hypothetical protein